MAVYEQSVVGVVGDVVGVVGDSRTPGGQAEEH